MLQLSGKKMLLVLGEERKLGGWGGGGNRCVEEGEREGKRERWRRVEEGEL